MSFYSQSLYQNKFAKDGMVTYLELVHKQTDEVHEVDKLRRFEVREHACHQWWDQVRDGGTHGGHDPRECEPGLSHCQWTDVLIIIKARVHTASRTTL
jgi:hypothetical protein